MASSKKIVVTSEIFIDNNDNNKEIIYKVTTRYNLEQLNLALEVDNLRLEKSIENENLLRPLINTKKSEIQDYAIKNNIAFTEDSTNQNNEISRNWIRNQLIPEVDERFPGAVSYTHLTLPTICSV